MIKRNTIIILLVVAFYPIFVTTALPSIFNTPFGAETVTRFIVPFEFHGNANINWAVMESTRWDIFRPVYSLSVLADYTLWGTNAHLYHLTDMLLSWLCYTMVFFLLKRRFGLLTAVLTVVLWAVHPAQPMSMERIIGRSDRLVTIFTVASLLSYDFSFSQIRHQHKLHLLTVFFTILAALSKDTGVFYALVLPGWSVLARGISLKETIISHKKLWLELTALGILFVLLRYLAGFSASIDAGQLNLGLNYFYGLSAFIMSGFPFPVEWIPDPVVVCVLAIATTGAVIFCKKSPGSSRFGAFAFSIFIFPFPFYWFQHTVLWGFWIWISLAFAGFANLVFKKFISRAGVTLQILFFFVITAIYSATAVWSAGIARTSCVPMFRIQEAVSSVTSVEDGPVYSEEFLFAALSGSFSDNEDFSQEEYQKIRTYIIELIQVETGNPAATIE
ncbi:hypothetical protein DRQ21_08960 [Candidatus Fermentibacteria bacterium]|nr:MAG: hypothetical protein DRQ21_08960 [Candidatus Fermentibacteria bacterium]